MSDAIQNEQDIEKKKKNKIKSEFDLNDGVQILPSPNRTLPKLIEELLEKDIPVSLSKNGYYIGGFYGLNANSKKGFVFAQDTSEANTLVFFDSKNSPCAVKNFEDLVKFHSHVWASFFKISEEYKKPESMWFGYMLEYSVLNITPK